MISDPVTVLLDPSSGCLFDDLAEPMCCGMTSSGDHALFCTLALARVCEDCGQGPGCPCFEFCSSMSGRDDDRGRETATVLAIVEPSREQSTVWHRVVDLMLPVLAGSPLLGFTLDGNASQTQFPVSPIRFASTDFRYAGWVDDAGLSLIVHHPHRPLTPGMVLAQRDRVAGWHCRLSSLAAVPVRLFLPSEDRPSSGRWCRCGHRAADHDGTGLSPSGCARWRDAARWCGCLRFDPAKGGVCAVSEDVTVPMTIVVDHDELARVLFGADLNHRCGVANIRAEIQRRVVTWGLDECSRRYKGLVREAVRAGQFREHLQQFNW